MPSLLLLALAYFDAAMEVFSQNASPRTTGCLGEAHASSPALVSPARFRPAPFSSRLYRPLGENPLGALRQVSIVPFVAKQAMDYVFQHRNRLLQALLGIYAG